MVIIDCRNPGEEELYKLILELAQSSKLSFDHVKKAVQEFENSRPAKLHLAEEFKKAMEELKTMTFELEKKSKDFPPSHINPFYRQYNGKKRR